MMFRLMNRTATGINPMLDCVDKHIKAQGLHDMTENAESITSVYACAIIIFYYCYVMSCAQDPEKYVEQLLTMFTRFSELVRDAFYDDPRFLTTRDKVKSKN